MDIEAKRNKILYIQDRIATLENAKDALTKELQTECDHPFCAEQARTPFPWRVCLICGLAEHRFEVPFKALKNSRVVLTTENISSHRKIARLTMANIPVFD